MDIYTAVKDGLPLNIEELKAAVDDPEGWDQEFECQFLDVQAVLLPYELIASCESADATATLPNEFWQTTAPWPIDMGIDFGRRHDSPNTSSWKPSTGEAHGWLMNRNFVCLLPLLHRLVEEREGRDEGEPKN